MASTPKEEQASARIFTLRNISDFRREIDENCAILSQCAASSGNSLPTFWDINLGFMRLGNGKDKLSGEVDKELRDSNETFKAILPANLVKRSWRK
jgi:hypothetical protein